MSNKKDCRLLMVAAAPITFEKLLYNLIERLTETGYSVDLCCGEGEYLQELVDKGYKVIVVPFRRAWFSLKHIIALITLYRILKKGDYDIVHFHTPIVSAIGRIAARMAKVRVILYTAHGFYFHEDMWPIIYKIFIFIEKVLAKYATDWLFLQSREDEFTAISNSFMKDRRRIIWIGNGVEPHKFITCKKEEKCLANKNDAHSAVFGFIGRVVREKGILELIEAFSLVITQYESARLMIIGGTLESDRDKSTAKKAMKLIKKHNLIDRIDFLGFRDDIPQLLSAIDIFVLPSYREGMPRSIIEAMMSGKPVIATNIRGCREEVVHGETGLLVSPKNVEELAEAMKYLASNPDLAREMGRKGRERAIELFDESYVLERQLAIYRKIVGELKKR